MNTKDGDGIVVVDSDSDSELRPAPKADEPVMEKRHLLWSRGERARSDDMMASALMAAARGLGWGQT